MDLREEAISMIMKAIEVVRPSRALLNTVRIQNHHLYIKDQPLSPDQFDGIYVIGFGKASAAMASSMEQILGDQLKSGIVITKYEHSVPTSKIKVVEAGHPVPDENTLRFTNELIAFLRNIPKKSLVFTLISGGGSALLESLPTDISLEDLQTTTSLLLKSGADITEINTIRKHISRVKGGQLLRYIYPRMNVSLIISDVIGDPLDFIASGPTSPDSTTFQEAEAIIQKYQLEEKIPSSVWHHIKKGVSGKISETPKEGDPIFENNKNIIIANNMIALKEIERQARENGFHPVILSHAVEGEARELGKMIAGIGRSVAEIGYPVPIPAAIIFGGESTVTVTGNGKGGRNQELATGFLTKSPAIKAPFAFVACGTDGTDGPTDAAGGIIDPDTLKKLSEKQLDPFTYLNNNDTYHLLKELDALLKTGPTQTNVMDINLLLIGADQE
jgi:glycerate-2-kinase